MIGKRDAAVWTMAFRPYFLAAAVWSAAAVVLWVLALTQGVTLPSRFSPLEWHIHEMLFGFVAAAISGFILTAIPNWTGREPVRGRLLAGLILLWGAGRFACLISAWLPAWFAVAVDAAMLPVLCVITAREILLAGDRRNRFIPVPIAVLAAANILMHLEALGLSVPAGLGWRLGIAAITIMISVIGGRIIPAFTRNWLLARGANKLPPQHGLFDSFAIATLHAGLMAWVFFPGLREAGVLLLAAAVLNIWRLTRWRGAATASEPLLTVLHIGYLWVALGAGLLGASMMVNAVPEAAAIHALTAGAIGTMVLAVMSRVSLGHTGRNLHSDPATVLAFALVTLSAITRITATIYPSHFFPLVVTSGGLWIASFLLFAQHYASILTSPRIGTR